MIKNYIVSKIIPTIRAEKYSFAACAMWIIFSVVMITYDAEMALYRAAREVFVDRAYDGLYLAQHDLYVCIDQHSCEHERGHAYDASSASKTWRYKEWRSTDLEFRANVDAIDACTAVIFDNYDILHTEYPKTSRSLMAARYTIERYSDEEEKKYREVYAALYAIMKVYRWDQYHYDDVEDMTAKKAIACQSFLDNNSETLRPRQN